MNVESLDRAYWERRKSARLRSTFDELGSAIQERRRTDMASLQVSRGWIEQAVAGQYDHIEISDPDWTMALRAVRDCSDAESRQSFGRLLLSVIDVAGPETLNVRQRKLFRFSLKSLCALHENWREWVRPVESWTPELNLTSEELILDLARYLYARWPVPAFLDEVWYTHNDQAIEGRALFIHIGAGRSLRELDQPYRMTRRTAHEFIQAPSGLSLVAARAWADMTAMGVDPDKRNLMMHTGLAGGLLVRTEQREFWLSVVRFYMGQSMYGMKGITNVLDFLEVKKFGGRDGTARSDASHPGLTMHGRTIARLRRDMELWHTELAMMKTLGHATSAPFTPSGREGLDLRAQSDDLLEPRSGWCIREIRNARELFEEGKAMRHCVMSYADWCVSGVRSIWSMAWVNDTGEARRCLTIELSREGRIEQIRGLANRRPTTSELLVVQKWADKTGLRWRRQPAVLRMRAARRTVDT